MLDEDEQPKCQWRGCEEPAMPGRRLCERHCSSNPSRFKPKELPSADRAKVLLSSESKAKRKKGMEMLCELNVPELIVEYALREKDSDILSVVSEELEFHPPELIRHLLTQPSSYFATLHMRFTVARGNFLYAEDVVHSVYAARRSLTLDVIEGIGLAYLRSLGDLLQKYIRVPLELYQDALRSKGPKAVAGVEGIDANGWSRDGWAAVRAIVALARTDSHCDLGHVQERLEDTIRIGRGVLPKNRIARSILGTRAQLEWALFDKGGPSTFDNVVGLVRQGAIEILPDLASTLLKQQRNDMLESLVREYPKVFFVAQEFVYWPLMNWLELNGILADEEYGGKDGIKEGGLYRYWRARKKGISPPPWWKWQ